MTKTLAFDYQEHELEWIARGLLPAERKTLELLARPGANLAERLTAWAKTVSPEYAGMIILGRTVRGTQG